MAFRISSSPWTGAVAPTAEDIGQIAEQAFRSLPNNVHAMCGDMIIRVEDMADEELIETLGGSSVYDLLGLFHPGGSFDEDDGEAFVVTEQGQLPALVLYRRAIVDYWAESDETLGAIVTHVIVHELGRQFGLSDDDLDSLETATLEQAELEQKSMIQ